MKNHNEIIMRKKILLLLMPFLFLMADAQARERRVEYCCYPDRMNFYAEIFGGANFLQNTTINGNKASYKTGYTASGSLGYCWRPSGLRLEAEYAFRRNGISKIDFVTEGSSNNGHCQASSYMGNLLWDLPLCSWGYTFWNIQPFIGTGVGGDFLRMHASNSRIVFNQKWTKFAWQLMAGFSYPIFRNAEIALEYKYHQGGSHFYNHAIGVGFVYKFGFIR
jgi:outer membrane autotransporter protein